MKYVFKEIGKLATSQECKDLNLETMQAMVGGYIEMVSIEDYIIICNEDGKIQGLKPNVIVADKNGHPVDVIVGNIIMVKRDRKTADIGDMSQADADRICANINHPMSAVLTQFGEILPIIERR